MYALRESPYLSRASALWELGVGSFQETLLQSGYLTLFPPVTEATPSASEKMKYGCE